VFLSIKGKHLSEFKSYFRDIIEVMRCGRKANVIKNVRIRQRRTKVYESDKSQNSDNENDEKNFVFLAFL
jgi:hypothetical protein